MMGSLHHAETKVLKQLVRDHIDPARDLGHSDKHGKKKEENTEDKKQELEVKQEKSHSNQGEEVKRNPDGTECEDCK
jgi:hypothetical protein